MKPQFERLLGDGHPALSHIRGLLSREATPTTCFWPPGTLDFAAAAPRIFSVIDDFADSKDPKSRMSLLIYSSQPRALEHNSVGAHSESLRLAYDEANTAENRIRESFEVVNGLVSRLLVAPLDPVILVTASLRVSPLDSDFIREVRRALRGDISPGSLSDGAAVSLYFTGIALE